MNESYFERYLSDYLRNNNFYLGFDFNSFSLVKEEAEIAQNAFENYRKNGYSVSGAIEISLSDLFSQVGISRSEMVEEILREILDTDSLTEREEAFVQKSIIVNPSLFENVVAKRFGLDPSSAEEMHEELAGRVKEAYRNYFTEFVNLN